MLTCDEFEFELSAYLDGALAPPERANVESHLAACASCKAALGAIGHARTSLASLPKLKSPAGLKSKVNAQISAEMHAPRPQTAPVPLPRVARTPWLAWGMSVAAGLAMALTGYLTFFRNAETRPSHGGELAAKTVSSGTPQELRRAENSTANGGGIEQKSDGKREQSAKQNNMPAAAAAPENEGLKKLEAAPDGIARRAGEFKDAAPAPNSNGIANDAAEAGEKTFGGANRKAVPKAPGAVAPAEMDAVKRNADEQPEAQRLRPDVAGGAAPKKPGADGVMKNAAPIPPPANMPAAAMKGSAHADDKKSAPEPLAPAVAFERAKTPALQKKEEELRALQAPGNAAAAQEKAAAVAPVNPAQQVQEAKRGNGKTADKDADRHAPNPAPDNDKTIFEKEGAAARALGAAKDHPQDARRDDDAAAKTQFAFQAAEKADGLIVLHTRSLPALRAKLRALANAENAVFTPVAAASASADKAYKAAEVKAQALQPLECYTLSFDAGQMTTVVEELVALQENDAPKFADKAPEVRLDEAQKRPAAKPEAKKAEPDKRVLRLEIWAEK